jgi:hypothetical protein
MRGFCGVEVDGKGGRDIIVDLPIRSFTRFEAPLVVRRDISVGPSMFRFVLVDDGIGTVGYLFIAFVCCWITTDGNETGTLIACGFFILSTA